ncbi:hypothetical protein DS565_28090 [Salmonella enterica subsp. enterica serovar Bareilly]|nr:hypothetical protein [Salmonella enterica subsp. enterica serovar Bareilly]
MVMIIIIFICIHISLCSASEISSECRNTGFNAEIRTGSALQQEGYGQQVKAETQDGRLRGAPFCCVTCVMFPWLQNTRNNNIKLRTLLYISKQLRHCVFYLPGMTGQIFLFKNKLIHQKCSQTVPESMRR